MKGWKIKKLGEVLALEYGKPLPQRDRIDDGIYPAYGANGVLCRTNRYYHDKPSFIVGRKGSAGEVNLTPDKFWPLDVTYFATFDDTKYDRMFLFHVMKFLDLQSLARGVKPGINRNDVYGLTFAFPALSEQRRIVAILQEVFSGLGAMSANADKNLENSRQLFDGYLSTVFAERGADWAERTLQEVSKDFGRGKSKHRPRNDPRLYGGKYPFIQTGEVRNCDHLIVESTQTYNEVGLAQSKLWPKGTICITIAANIAETGILGFDACFPDSVIGIVVDPTKTSNHYVEYLLQSVKVGLKAQGKGTAQDNINLATFEKLRFPFPDLPEQENIVRRLDSLADRIRGLESLYRQKLEAIAELRRSILQKAFAGGLAASESIAA